MAVISKAKFEGELTAGERLAEHFPGLMLEPDETGFWLSGPQLMLGPNIDDIRDQLASFAREANAIIALASPFLAAIHPSGLVQIVDGESRSLIVLPEPAKIELIGHPVTLSARGGGRTPRGLAVRVAELRAKVPRFGRAANLLAEAGTDVTKLYMVMELIERHHAIPKVAKCAAHEHPGFPKKRDRAARAAFCQAIEVNEADWEALHRTVRPFRHAEPHEDGGPVVSPLQARVLIQHALKLWLEREVPT